jgi:hypothetical protein
VDAAQLANLLCGLANNPLRCVARLGRPAYLGYDCL